MVDDSVDPDQLKKDLEEALSGSTASTLGKLAIAAFSGAIPVVGGAIGYTGSHWSEKEQEAINRLFQAWLKLQERELKEIGLTLAEVMLRIDSASKDVRSRIESPEYLSLVRKCFRDWSAAESEAKRQLIRNLLVNAANSRITHDDVVKLFIKWNRQPFVAFDLQRPNRAIYSEAADVIASTNGPSGDSPPDDLHYHLTTTFVENTSKPPRIDEHGCIRQKQR